MRVPRVRAYQRHGGADRVLSNRYTKQRFPFLVLEPLIESAAQEAPPGRRHSSQIIEGAKNPSNPIVKGNFHGKP
jgi:hypothetical protein